MNFEHSRIQGKIKIKKWKTEMLLIIKRTKSVCGKYD